MSLNMLASFWSLVLTFRLDYIGVPTMSPVYSMNSSSPPLAHVDELHATDAHGLPRVGLRVGMLIVH